MQDEKIVQLYWDRDEQAIGESSAKYGKYCGTIAGNILNSRTDAEECVNDTWLRAWNSMPPHRPVLLSVFLGKITRNLAFDRYRALRREKRGGGQMDLVLEELEECVSDRDDPAQQHQVQELMAEINAYLLALPKTKRDLFILRYWYADSIRQIAEKSGLSENNVSVSLSRMRKDLKAHLHERGYDL